MKRKAPVLTLALLGALALAALSGGLLPSDSVVHAQQAPATNMPPAFSDETADRSVEENTPPAVNTSATPLRLPTRTKTVTQTTASSARP